MSEEFQYPLPGSGKPSSSWNSRRIKALREHLQLTQRQMADELQVRQQVDLVDQHQPGGGEHVGVFHTPHRSTQKILSMVAERAGFDYTVTPQPETEEPTVEPAQGPEQSHNGA